MKNPACCLATVTGNPFSEISRAAKRHISDEALPISLKRQEAAQTKVQQINSHGLEQFGDTVETETGPMLQLLHYNRPECEVPASVLLTPPLGAETYAYVYLLEYS